MLICAHKIICGHNKSEGTVFILTFFQCHVQGSMHMYWMTFDQCLLPPPLELADLTVTCTAAAGLKNYPIVVLYSIIVLLNILLHTAIWRDYFCETNLNEISSYCQSTMTLRWLRPSWLMMILSTHSKSLSFSRGYTFPSNVLLKSAQQYFYCYLIAQLWALNVNISSHLRGLVIEGPPWGWAIMSLNPRLGHTKNSPLDSQY